MRLRHVLLIVAFKLSLLLLAGCASTAAAPESKGDDPSVFRPKHATFPEAR